MAERDVSSTVQELEAPLIGKEGKAHDRDAAALGAASLGAITASFATHL